jgi:hypothetical protein
MYHDGCVSGVLYIDYDCDKPCRDNRHFYMDPYQEHDCEFFEKNEIGRNQKFLREWKEDCYGKKNLQKL